MSTGEVVQVTAVMDRYERELLAHRAWDDLPHGGRDALVMQVQCAEGHHVAKVFTTESGDVVRTTVRRRAHGSRDLPDEPHTPHDAHHHLDLLVIDDVDDDEIPAWCDCGPRALSRAALREWRGLGETRVVVD